MIVELGKVLIDTSLDHEAHKIAIKRRTNFYCRDDEPIQWFTQPSPDIEGKDRYFHLTYNKEGSELEKITSYDYLGHGTKMVRKRKDVDDKCYFSRNKPHTECDVYELVEEIDFSTPLATHDVTLWEKGWAEPAHQELPITQEVRRKRWGLF